MNDGKIYYKPDDESAEEIELLQFLAKESLCATEWKLFYPCEGNNPDWDVFAKDAEFSIPDGGITLRHGDEAIGNIPQEAIEAVYSKDGTLMYLSINASLDMDNALMDMIQAATDFTMDFGEVDGE